MDNKDSTFVYKDIEESTGCNFAIKYILPCSEGHTFRRAYVQNFFVQKFLCSEDPISSERLMMG